MNDTCSPGGHPHSDKPNWKPADNADDYLSNCNAGLETYSDRRMAELFGCSRIDLWRAKRIAELPEELFERLLTGGIGSSKALAAAAHVLSGADMAAETECCPHCGGVLRRRAHISEKAARIIDAWLAQQETARAGE